MTATQHGRVPKTLVTQHGSARLSVVSDQSESLTASISYKFDNGGSENAYVFNRLYLAFPSDVFRTDRNLIYVEEKPEGFVLAKKIIEVPFDREVEKPVVPCVTRIQPKAIFEETIRLALPLRPFTPYYNPLNEQLEGSPVNSRIWFELGYFTMRDEIATRLGKRLPTTDGGTCFYFYPFQASDQSVLRVGPLDVQLSAYRAKK